MKPNFKISRKTWYAMLLAAACASMLGGMAALAGQNLAILNTVAFGLTGLAVLYLAAERGTPVKEKQQYFGVFVVLLLGYVFGAPVGYVFGALAWPLLLAVESRRGSPVQLQLRLVTFAEVLHLALLLMAGAGMDTGFMTNLFWVLVTIARGWAALQLYRARTEEE